MTAAKQHGFRIGESHLVAVFALVGCCMAGCHSAPERVSVYDSATDAQVEVASSEYWSKEVATSDSADPEARRGPTGPQPGDRVIVSEFAVEFVQEKLESPFESQLAAAPATPITIGFSLIGLGRVQIDFDEEHYQRIATHTYELFLDELAAAGLTVVDHEACNECEIFESLATASAETESSVLQKFNAFATDTGRIKEIRTVAPQGMQLLDRNGPVGILEAERSVRDQTGVDWVLRTRFRVGIYRGLLSVEQDSQILAVGDARAATIKSRRSLLSPDLAVDPERFEAFRGDVFRIDTDRFLHALDQTLPTYARMAILRAGSAR